MRIDLIGPAPSSRYLVFPIFEQWFHEKLMIKEFPTMTLASTGWLFNDTMLLLTHTDKEYKSIKAGFHPHKKVS
jgi:hypothetical protein